MFIGRKRLRAHGLRARGHGGAGTEPVAVKNRPQSVITQVGATDQRKEDAMSTLIKLEGVRHE